MSKLELTDECAYQLDFALSGRGRDASACSSWAAGSSDSVWVTSGGRQFRLDASHGEDFI